MRYEERSIVLAHGNLEAWISKSSRLDSDGDNDESADAPIWAGFARPPLTLAFVVGVTLALKLP